MQRGRDRLQRPACLTEACCARLSLLAGLCPQSLFRVLHHGLGIGNVRRRVCGGGQVAAVGCRWSTNKPMSCQENVEDLVLSADLDSLLSLSRRLNEECASGE
jgi:hypothetical protein